MLARKALPHPGLIRDAAGAARRAMSLICPECWHDGWNAFLVDGSEVLQCRRCGAVCRGHEPVALSEEDDP